MTAFSDQTHRSDPQDQAHQPDREGVDSALTASASTPSTNGGDRPATREQHLEDRIHQVLEQKLISLLDNESTNREILWLRRQVNWSIGFLVVLIVMIGGAFTWFAYLLRTDPPTIQTDPSAAIAPIDEERLTAIEAQLQTLNGRIPEDWSTALSANSEQLQTVSSQIEAVSESVGKNQQALTNLEASLQSLEDSLLLKEENEVDSSSLEGSSRTR